MRTVFALLLVAHLAIWIFSAYVPARYENRSERRVFFPQLVFVPYYLLGAYAYVAWKPFVPSKAPWQTLAGSPRHAFNACGFVCALLLNILAIWPAYLAADSNAGAWWPFPQSACGQSSCSRELQNVGVVYNPRGHFDVGPFQYEDYRHTTCVYERCSFAGSSSSTSETARAYKPRDDDPSSPSPLRCAEPDCILTTRPDDWPNPAFGAREGFILGVQNPVSRVGLCPGVFVDQDGRVAGRKTCAYCLPYFRKRFGLVDEARSHCPQRLPSETGAYDLAAEDNWMCGVFCPNDYEDLSPDAQAANLVRYLVGANHALLSWAFQEAFAWVRWSWRERATDGAKRA